MKFLFILAGFTLLAAGCTTVHMATQSNTHAVPANTALHKIHLEWTVQNLGDPNNGNADQKIGLALKGALNTTTPLGTFQGCHEGDDTHIKTKDQLLYLYCWWAGGGDELSVVRSGPTTLSILDHQLDEGTNPSDVVLKTIPIPADVTIQ